MILSFPSYPGLCFHTYPLSLTLFLSAFSVQCSSVMTHLNQAQLLAIGIPLTFSVGVAGAISSAVGYPHHRHQTH